MTKEESKKRIENWVEKNLPSFSKACKEEADRILLLQTAFAEDLTDGEIYLLGAAIKYAGFYKKEVHIIP